MAGSILSALAAVPWTTILKQAPIVIAAARGVQDTMRPPPPPLRADADIQALRERLGQLADTQQEHARALAQLGEHVDRLARATDAAHQLCRRAMLLGGTAVGVGVVAAMMAWLL